ncbi:hypothetical protein D3C71_1006970 [compost metagenome]
MFKRKPCSCPRCATTPANARQLVKVLSEQADYACKLPPGELVVGLHQAHQALTAVLAARTPATDLPASDREVLTTAVIDAVKRHRSLVHSPHSVHAAELAEASQQVDAALAALAAHDFDYGAALTA